VNDQETRSITDADVDRVVDLLHRGLPVDWNGAGPQVAPRGRLLEYTVETSQSERNT
jgi:hypothetical protein